MKYNFDEIIDRRNTNALNTDGFRGYIFHAGPEMRMMNLSECGLRIWNLRHLPKSVKPLRKG